ncbi:MAG TPA: thiamine diphosphokinase, partial [Thermoflexales bacterium]|nr:thiamine diphosphokinase [Thermoflexales bacterium]
MSRAIIIANGDAPTREVAGAWLRAGDTLICADGGGRAALALGLSPQFVIGDFDSLTPDELNALAARGAALMRYPREKDETDLELALLFAAPNYDEIIILGAGGGRLDQTLANMMLLAMPQITPRHRAIIVTANEEVSLIYPGHLHELRGKPGSTVSLLPMGGAAVGITTTGLQYQLRDETLKFGPARGVSNVMLGDRASVFVRSGN